MCQTDERAGKKGAHGGGLYFETADLEGGQGECGVAESGTNEDVFALAVEDLVFHRGQRRGEHWRESGDIKYRVDRNLTMLSDVGIGILEREGRTGHHDCSG